MYVPPRYNAPRRQKHVEFIEEIIERVKKEIREPLIVIGGDFNNTKLIPLIEKFQEEGITDSTRKGRNLDIPTSRVRDQILQPLMPHEVSSRLKHCKKPHSTVEGDVMPQLVSAFHDLLAVPLMKISNQERDICTDISGTELF